MAVSDVFSTFASFFAPLDCSNVLAAWHVINDTIWEKYARGLLTSNQLKLERAQQLIDWARSMRGPEGMPSAEQVRDVYLERYEAQCALYDGVIPMLEGLADRYSLGIITNGFSNVQSGKMAVTGLSRFFHTVVVSEDVGVHKPNAEIFRIATERAGVRPEESVYVGDNYLWDVRGALHAGLRAVWFNPGNQHPPAEYSDVEPTAVVRSVAEVAGLFGVPPVSPAVS